MKDERATAAPPPTVLRQQVLLERIREHAVASPEILGLLAFGSLATGTADAFSDLDLGLYVADEAVRDFDLRHWLEAVAPIAAVFTTEYCSTVVFRDLIRAEIHLGPESAADVWPSLAGALAYPSLERIVLLDRSGTFTDRVRPLVGRLPPRSAQDGDHEFLGLVNWLLVADGCRRRGELARAMTHLAAAHVHLLRLARLDEGATEEWLSPERGLERHLSAAAYDRFVAATTPLGSSGIRAAISATWRWGRELAGRSAARPLDDATLDDLEQRFAPRTDEAGDDR